MLLLPWICHGGQPHKMCDSMEVQNISSEEIAIQLCGLFYVLERTSNIHRNVTSPTFSLPVSTDSF